jgi:AraC family transcriptional regulator, transcriptional activator of pobA
MSTILSYAFYGEDGEPHRQELLHCETLKARSVLHDWRFRPHRHHRMHQFFWINAGSGVATIDGVEWPIGAMTAMSLPPMTVHGFVFQPGIEGWVITMPIANLEAVLANSNTVMARLRAPAIFVANQSAEAIFARIAEEFARFSAEREQALTSLTGLLAVWLAREMAALPAFAHPTNDRGMALVLRFLRAIDAELCDHRPLTAYASALGVTPTHLSRICRRLTGRSASHLIYDRLALEARRQLTYTPHPVSEIGYRLGFEDPAHFAKFFRKQTGQSPSAFRAAFVDRVPMSTSWR